MRDGFLKSVKNFFGKPNTPPKIKEKQNDQPEVPRVVSFGTKEQPVQREGEEGVDNRYLRVDGRPTLKELGIKRDEWVDGELPVLSDNKFVQCKVASGQYAGVLLIVSNYQLFVKTSDRLIRFPLGKVEKLQKYTNKENQHKLMIGLKDGRCFKFRVYTEPMWKKIYEKIEDFAFVKHKRQFFAYKYYQANKQLELTFRGWQTYDVVKEFMRLGVELMPHSEVVQKQFTSDFKILDNRDGRVCSTYAEQIIVPARVPFDCLVRCSRFRSRNRMPALTYLYHCNLGTQVGLYRASQSKVGVSNSRSPQDEFMLRAIGDPRSDPKDSGQTGVNCVIYDARNKIAAFGNKVAGKGYESEEYYQNCRIEFLNISNIHAVRESYQKAVRAAQGEDARFFSSLADSEWYDYIFTILQGAVQIAKSLSEGLNVLVHCSDGWDRTSQLCSLAGILLDPFYRTMIGFQTLVEKDWIRFGHQFAVRMGQGINQPASEERSPVFLQFLDCVSQLVHQFPCEFQFGFSYLQELAELSQSNIYGTFLCNCEQEMKGNQIQTQTVSVWSYFLKNREAFLNPYFNAAHNRLRPSTAQKHFRFWKQHFLQHVEGFQDLYDIYSCRFTDDNLDIIYKHLKQEKRLLEEKLTQSKTILDDIGKETQRVTDLPKQ